MRRALVVAVLFVPSAVWGQWSPGSPSAVSRWELGLSAGYSFGGGIDGVMPDDESQTYAIDLENGASFALDLAIPVGGDGHIQVWASRQTTDLESSYEAPGGAGLVGEIQVTHVQLMWIKNFLQPRGPSYYAGVGIGMSQLEPDIAGASSESGLAASVAVGAKMFIGRHAGIRFDLRVVAVNTEDDVAQGAGDLVFRYKDYFTQTQASLGIVFLW